ncbi:TPA: hypothetical protein NJ349_004694 [Vibrio parahaemolyticus]|nr:hypothetical protein [Vibrio parahaemolyticus]
MYEHEIPKQVLDTYKLPLRIKLMVWFLALSIMGIGAYLSHLERDWMLFARSGSLVVVVSLSLAAFGFGQKFINSVVKMVEPVALKIVAMQVSKRPYLYGVQAGLKDEELAAIIEKVTRERITSINTIMHKRLAQSVQKTEFVIAALGTLVWGFGDLIGKVVY